MNYTSKNPNVTTAMALGVALVFMMLQLAVAKNRDVVNHKRDLFEDEFFSSPFMIDSGLMALKNEMDRQMQELLMLEDVFPTTHGFLRGAEMMMNEAAPGAYEIAEDEHQVIMMVSIPEGVVPEIEVIDGTVMHIRESSMNSNKGTSSMYLDKRFAMGKHMDQDNIAAQLQDGTLTITTPKVQEKKNDVRKIPIRVDEL